MVSIGGGGGGGGSGSGGGGGRGGRGGEEAEKGTYVCSLADILASCCWWCRRTVVRWERSLWLRWLKMGGGLKSDMELRFASKSFTAAGTQSMVGWRGSDMQGTGRDGTGPRDGGRQGEKSRGRPY